MRQSEFSCIPIRVKMEIEILFGTHLHAQQPNLCIIGVPYSTTSPSKIYYVGLKLNQTQCCQRLWTRNPKIYEEKTGKCIGPIWELRAENF